MVEMEGMAFGGSQCSGLFSHGLHTYWELILSLMKSHGPLGFSGCLCYPNTTQRVWHRAMDVHTVHVSPAHGHCPTR